MKGNVLAEGEIIAKEEKYTEFFSINLFQNLWANFNQTWYKSSLGKGILYRSNKGPAPLPREDYRRNAKNGGGVI
jgi:hypothetical protein